MSKSATFIKRVIVSLIGFPLLVVGAILVPLPGPGFLVMFIALLILSTEFEWAGKHSDKLKKKFKEVYEKSMAKAESIERRTDKHGK